MSVRDRRTYRCDHPDCKIIEDTSMFEPVTNIPAGWADATIRIMKDGRIYATETRHLCMNHRRLIEELLGLDGEAKDE